MLKKCENVNMINIFNMGPPHDGEGEKFILSPLGTIELQAIDGGDADPHESPWLRFGGRALLQS
jgi:hypothetical protein